MADEEKFSKTFCIHPWTQLNVSTLGDVANCCLQNTEDVFLEEDVFGSWNGDRIKKVRKDMLAGKRPSSCNLCWELEDQGINSKRVLDLQMEWPGGVTQDQLEASVRSTKEDGSLDSLPTFLELKLGNKCNLMCRMCNPFNSSPLFAEQLKMKTKGLNSELSDDEIDFLRSRKDWSDNIDMNELRTLVSGLSVLNISGGEPLMNDKVRTLLQELVESGQSQSMSLVLTSNGTIVDEEFFRQMGSFRSSTLILSIDGIETTYEYIRHPAEWKDISENCIQINSICAGNTDVVISPTVQVLNVLGLGDLIDWATSHNLYWEVFDFVTDPPYLDVRWLPENVKEEALKRIKVSISHMKPGQARQRSQLEDVCSRLQVQSPQNTSILEEFYSQCRTRDQLRNQSFQASASRLSALLAEAYG